MEVLLFLCFWIFRRCWLRVSAAVDKAEVAAARRVEERPDLVLWVLERVATLVGGGLDVLDVLDAASKSSPSAPGVVVSLSSLSSWT